MPYTDNELLRLVQLDDNKAFTALYKRYWKLLYAPAYKRLKDGQLAEDVVHDVLLSIWKNRLNLQVENLERYLVSATKYTIMASIRKNRRELTIEPTPDACGTENHTESAYYYRQLYDLAIQEMDMLPEKCKLVFKYSRQQGLSNREIADILHISPKTVENQITRALHQLRLSLRGMLHFFF